MKLIESREQEKLSLNPPPAANEPQFLPDRSHGARAPEATLPGTTNTNTNTGGTAAGWSPYEVWRTRVRREPGIPAPRIVD